MKKLFTLLAATVTVALCLVSCKKDNAGSKYGTANIGGTDEVGNKLVVKGTATLTNTMQ